VPRWRGRFWRVLGRQGILERWIEEIRRERGWMMRCREVVFGITSRLLRSLRTRGMINKSEWATTCGLPGVDRRMVSPSTRGNEMHRLPACPPALLVIGNLDHLLLLPVRLTWEHHYTCFGHILLRHSRAQLQHLPTRRGLLQHSVVRSRTLPPRRTKRPPVRSLRDMDICWLVRTNRRIFGDRGRIVILHLATLVDRISHPGPAWV
jgi:hypothetical protein